MLDRTRYLTLEGVLVAEALAPRQLAGEHVTLDGQTYLVERSALTESSWDDVMEQTLWVAPLP